MLAPGAAYSQYSTPGADVHETLTPASPGSTVNPPTGGAAVLPLPPQADKKATAVKTAIKGLIENKDI
jgi:hypothetical protein